jgi:hypothetical protein
MVAQEAIGRLARLFRKTRTPSNLCALDLPLEIMLMIGTHLEECALVSLTLTCQSLHGLWGRRSLPFQSREKEKLLLLLEKDIPFLYYCHHCIKLHRWYGRWSRSIARWYEERLPCNYNLKNHLYIPFICHIPYHHARLVMNRHLYGSKHGLPLQVLNERDKSIRYSDGVVKSVSQEARIFNNQLLVLSVISLRHLRGDWVLLRSHIDSHAYSICEHLLLARGYYTSVPIQLPKLVEKGNALSQFLACGPPFGSCTSCLTDYSINILWQGEKKGYTIEVLVYHGLGDCRSPFDWHWRAMSTRDSTGEVRAAYSPDHRPASVRVPWNKAGEIAETTGGASRRARLRGL